MENVKGTGQIIDSLTAQSIQNGVISEGDAAIYRYGLKHLLLMPIYFLSYIFIGIMTDNLFWLCVYLLAFTAIRVYAGGFHLKHRSTCFVFTMGMVALTSILLKNYGTFYNPGIWIVIMAAAYAVIMWLAPVDSSKRVFDGAERIYFRKIAVIIANTELFLFVVAFMTKNFYLAFVFVLAFLEEAVFLLVGKWLRERDKREE